MLVLSIGWGHEQGDGLADVTVLQVCGSLVVLKRGEALASAPSVLQRVERARLPPLRGYV